MSNLPKPQPNVVWSRDRGWHDGPEVDLTLDDKGRIKADPKRASITAAIHAAAMRKDKK